MARILCMEMTPCHAFDNFLRSRAKNRRYTFCFSFFE
jgi:hypothetical protein